MLHKFYDLLAECRIYNAYIRIPSSLDPLTNNLKVTKYVYLQTQIKNYLIFSNIAYGSLVLALASKKLPKYFYESGIVFKTNDVGTKYEN